MQFQIPQFIETEDKIVGPFTLKQFIYIAIAGILIFFLYFLVQPWLWTILSTFLVAAGISFAFIKVNGKPFSQLLLSAASFYWKPQTYVWQSENPHVKKEEIAESKGLGSIMSGLLLKNTWQNLQTKSKTTVTGDTITRARERYQVFQRITGERKLARRIDYR